MAAVLPCLLGEHPAPNPRVRELSPESSVPSVGAVLCMPGVASYCCATLGCKLVYYALLLWLPQYLGPPRNA